MNNSGILFVIEKTSDDNYAACEKSIRELKIPVGFELNIAQWIPNEKMDFIKMHNYFRLHSGAQYKVYLRDTICAVNENILVEMLDIFSQDQDIALIGVQGAVFLPESGRIEDSEQRCGGIYRLDGKEVKEKRYHEIDGDYQLVHAVDYAFLVERYDLWWNVSSGPAFWGQAVSMEYWKNGYKVVTPRQPILWCLDIKADIGGKNNEGEQRQFYHEYASYMLEERRPIRHLLRFFGEQSVMADDIWVTAPENVQIGSLSEIGRGVILQARAGRESCISIGNGVIIKPYSVVDAKQKIEIEGYVHIDEQVKITNDSIGMKDFHIPMEEDETGGNVFIGRGTHIGANSVIGGGIRVGRGCVILPNSLITEDIPDYCMVDQANHITQYYDSEQRKWVSAADLTTADIQELRLTQHPVVTIGVPTYNRSWYLRKSLRSICRQIGNDPFFEIVVSDNASTDNTAEVCSKFTSRYRNVCYRRNSENIGAENIYSLYKIAKGDYVVSAGDDDYYDDEVLYEVLELALSREQPAIIVLKRNGNIEYNKDIYSGINQYVEKISFESTFISILFFKQELVVKAMEDEKFNTNVWQAYLQMKVINQSNRFAIVHGLCLNPISGETAIRVKYESLVGYADTFVRKYFSIVQYALSYGLTKETLDAEKKKVLYEQLLPNIKNIKKGWFTSYRVDDDIMDIYDEFYQDTDFYQEGREQLLNIVQ